MSTSRHGAAESRSTTGGEGAARPGYDAFFFYREAVDGWLAPPCNAAVRDVLAPPPLPANLPRQDRSAPTRAGGVQSRRPTTVDAVCQLVDWMVLPGRPTAAKEVEILVLRQQ
jgi:hypothetical protein